MSEKKSGQSGKRVAQKWIILSAVLAILCICLAVWNVSLMAERRQLRDDMAALKAGTQQEETTPDPVPEKETTGSEDEKEQEPALEETAARYFDMVETGENTCTITGYSGRDVDVVIPAEIDGRQVTKIGEKAFYDLKVTSVVIPEGVTEIEDRAFERCDKLTSVTIPETVAIIGAHAFENCSKLASVTIPASVTEIGDFAFNACMQLKSVEFAEGLQRIGEEAFNACHMESISLPDSLTEIGRGAFINCYFLKKVELPQGLTGLSEELFAECINLVSIELPETVADIGSSAFSGCARLKEVHIPDGVTSIGKDAFAECDALVVFVSRDSYAANWAMDNGVDREYVEAENPQETPATEVSDSTEETV